MNFIGLHFKLRRAWQDFCGIPTRVVNSQIEEFTAAWIDTLTDDEKGAVVFIFLIRACFGLRPLTVFELEEHLQKTRGAGVVKRG
jgi:hypothetical protein